MKLRKNLILLVIIIPMLGGCTACIDCGGLTRRNEVTSLFTSVQVVQEYNYFYNGTLIRPKAIIGVDKALTVEGKFWNFIELTTEQLSRWVKEIDTRPQGGEAAGVFGRFEGFEILDPDGARVGIWYSNYDWGVFKFPGDGRIVVYSPSFKPGSGTFSINAEL